MFFYLSKILNFITSPFIWGFSILIYALLTKNTVRKKRALIYTITIFYIFSNPFIFNECMRAWEVPAVKFEDLEPSYNYAIVLGGMVSNDAKLHRINFHRSVDRILQAVDLYRKDKVEKILISGGSGSITYSELKEGEILKDFLANLGLDKNDIIAESKSKNTYENAIYSAKLLSKTNNKPKILLVTSAYHLRRAKACFDKINIPTTPFATDRYSGPRKFTFDHLIVPNVEVLQSWSVLFHEIIGYLTYYIVGYI